MPDRSSPEVGAGALPTPVSLAPPGVRRAAMIALGYLPALHLALVAACALAPAGVGARLGLAVAVLYLLPPLGARVSGWLLPLPRGRVGLEDRGFLAWWLSAQWQLVFSRLRFLEEALRLFPAVYSAWLRLWGARVGALVYWSPGVELLDRSLLEVGDRVVFGAGVRIAGHTLLAEGGRTWLVVAPVRIGRGALVGAQAVLAPGVEIAEGTVSPPFRLVKAAGSARREPR